jgi:hypothetical protein
MPRVNGEALADADLIAWVAGLLEAIVPVAESEPQREPAD